MVESKLDVLITRVAGGRLRGLGSGYAAFGVLTVVAVTIFWILKQRWLTDGPAAPWSALAATCAVSLLGIRLRARDLSKAGRIFLNGITTAMAAYVLAIDEAIPPGEDTRMSALIGGVQLSLPALTVLAWYRPSVSILALSLMVWLKHSHEFLLGIPESYGTEYLAVPETAQFFAIGLVCQHLFCAKNQKLVIKGSSYLLTDWLLLAAVAVHFANYFCSALAKVMLNGGYLSWAVDNETWWLTVLAHHAGMLPVDTVPWLRNGLFALLQSTVVAANAFVLVTQLICILVFRWRLAVMLLLVTFDVVHVMIFVATGIFFWKWILLNTALLVALKYLSFERTPWVVVAACMSVTLLAQHVFYIAWLGWYDTRAANIGHVYALTDDGREYRLPSNYFKPFSVVMSRHDYMTIAPRRWPTNTWATTVDHDLMRSSANSCDIPLAKGDSAIDEAALAMWRPKIERYHRYVLSSVDNRGLINYDLYPHHIWSNP